MSNNTTNNNGVGFFGLLTLLFIGLKLGNIINWSWWLVLIAPVIGTSLLIVWLIVCLIFIFVKKGK
jgi:hypothetical protein